MKLWFEPEPLQQRSQPSDEVGADGDIVTGVGTVLLEGGRAVVTEYSRVEGHDQPILYAHPSHLQQHVPTEVTDLRRARPTSKDRLKQGLGILDSEVERVGLFHAVVGRNSPVCDEVLTTRLQRMEVSGERG